jgi:hypothetical protein
LAEGGNFNEAIDLARSIEDDSYRDLPFCRIAQALAEGGQFNEAIESVSSIEGDRTVRNSALVDLAVALAGVGKDDELLISA